MASPPRNGSGPQQDPRHQQAAELLALGHTQRAAARQVGVSERTIREWAGKPAFAALVSEFRGGFVGQALDRLKARAHGLIDKLLALTDSEDERISLAALRDALDRAGVSAAMQMSQAELALKREALEAQRAASATSADLLQQLADGLLCGVPEGPER